MPREFDLKVGLKLPDPPQQTSARYKNSRPASRASVALPVIPAQAGICPAAFTLPELLIAIGIFATVVTLVSSLYIQSFRESRRANLQNQIYEDSRYIMTRLADEIRSSMIDYDEYYNQSVIGATLASGGAIPGRDPTAPQHYGQNYGRYYSAFFHPGNDAALGFDCNDGGDRNRRECTPLRRTLDRNTGANPFTGKYNDAASEHENAFCGNVSYSTAPRDRPGNQGACDPLSGDPMASAPRTQNELYLISADGFEKTILAREEIRSGHFALSMLKLRGIDINRDSIADRFVCSDEFQCRGSDNVPDVDSGDHEISETGDCAAGGTLAAELPRGRSDELEFNPAETCDTEAVGFSKDFVPISPFHVNVADLQFFISPDENPHYAFAEGAATQKQPSVTILLTVTHPEIKEPVTLVQTVFSLVLSPTPAPLLAE